MKIVTFKNFSLYFLVEGAGLRHTYPKGETSLNHNMLLTIGFIAIVLFGGGVYFNWPYVISWLKQNEGIEIIEVTLSENIYRTEELKIYVEVFNKGDENKVVLVKINSKDSPSKINSTKITVSKPSMTICLSIPVKSLGQQDFTVDVFWVGPLKICKIKQDSKDVVCNVLGAEYEVSFSPKFASIAENFDLKLNIENKGNAPANRLDVQLIEKGCLSIFQPDSVTIENFKAGESKTAIFRFTVPHDAKEGIKTINISFTSHYPNGKETIEKEFKLNLQKSPTQVQLENIKFWALLILAIIIAISITFVMARARIRF